VIAVVIATGAVLLAPTTGPGPGGPAVPDTAHARVAMVDSTAADSAATRPAVSESTASAANVLELRKTATIDLSAPRGIGPVEPVGVALDGFGRLYVSDLAGRRLIRLDAAGHLLGESGALGSDEGLLRRPGHVVPAGALAMALLDEENRRVLVYDLYGRVQETRIDFGSDAGSTVTGHVTPIALASDRSAVVYVADAEGDRVLVYDPSGRLMRIVSGFGGGPGAFHGLAGVSVGRRGDLIVTEGIAARVQRLDPSGRLAATWPLPQKPGGKRLPVAVDDSLRVAVADETGGRVWVFDSSGALLAEIRSLQRPSALTFGRDGALWIAERGAAKLTRYEFGPAPGGSR
jgi:DNA-binding beta-propeller fold protein YncE